MKEHYTIAYMRWIEDPNIRDCLALLLKIASLTSMWGACVCSNRVLAKYMSMDVEDVEEQINALFEFMYIDIYKDRQGRRLLVVPEIRKDHPITGFRRVLSNTEKAIIRMERKQNGIQ